MQNRTRAAIVATAIVGVAAVGGGVALAAGGGDDDGTETSITGEELDRASAAALEHTGEGRVTETEVGDEESYYEVEVTLDDGSQVDVQLDKSFKVVGSSADHEERDGSGNDAD
jgi:uncharacterized membrane protein YkoI